MLSTIRRMYRSNPTFTVYWLWMIGLSAAGTVYLGVVQSEIALLTFVLGVYGVGVFAGAAMFGKGTPRNAARALGKLLRPR